MPNRALVLAMLLSTVLAAGCADPPAGPGDEEEASSEQGESDVLGPEPTGQPVRYPIVLASGFGTARGNFDFYGVAAALRADGHAVYESEAPPYQSAEVRATYLASTVQFALGETGAEKVNIIAHSMGGLDARALVSTYGYGDRVASVTTISTPHHGSYFADVALGLVGGFSDRALDAFAYVLGVAHSDLASDVNLRAALADITETYSDAWNDAHPDDPNVAYASWAGVSSPFGVPNSNDDLACWDVYLTNQAGDHPATDVLSPLMAATAPFVAHGLEARPNDGLVTVESARWGAFFGCIPADHADEVGQVAHEGPDWLTGFDHRRFYRNLAYELASVGF